MADNSFFGELRKRKVVQAAAIYGAVAWGLTEVIVTIVEQLFLPQWVSTLAVIFFVMGFPVAMFLAWTFDISAGGLRRTTVSSRRGAASIVTSMVLLVVGTAGLFFLIKPGLQVREAISAPAAVPVQPNSLAILPFANVGGNSEDLYLANGLSDALRDQLAQVSGLRIAARSSSVAAVEQGFDALTMSSRLGVASLVEGTVRRERNLLLVSVQLIDGRTGLAKWSRIFERGPRELLAVQEALAEAIVEVILPDAESMVAKPATRDPTANELMLLARHYEQQVRERHEVDVDTLLEAIRLYREATEADPESALAHSRLAGALMYLGDVDAAEAPINRALTINPNLSEVQNTLGEFRWARGQVRESRIAWARAVELNPNNPDALQNYARARWWASSQEGVPELYRRAVALDPLNLERYAALGAYLAIEDFTTEARDVVAVIKQLFDGAPASRVLADLLDYLGDVDRSIAWTIRARNLEPNNPSHVHKLAEFYADIGDYETALRLDPNAIGILFKMRRFEDVIDLAELAMIDEPQDMLLRAVLATSYNALGKYDSAIRVLSGTGLPESQFDGWRTAEEEYGFAALKNALYGIDDTETARRLAHITIYEIGYSNNSDWFHTLRKACDFAILGNDESALAALSKAQQSFHLPWDPFLKDVPCFERLKENPVYQATVRHYDGHRAMLRQRLPATLAEFGISL